jgi:hypothetical protein
MRKGKKKTKKEKKKTGKKKHMGAGIAF